MANNHLESRNHEQPAALTHPPRKFLFVSEDGLTGDLAWQIRKEGNEVRCAILSRREREIMDGFVEKVDAWEPYVDWADVVVFDDIGFAAQVERLRKAGKPVIGGPAYTDRLELDRDFGQAEMKAAGMVTPQSWDFTSFDDAIAFVQGNSGRYVVKPSGKAQNEKVLSFVGQEEDGRDTVTILQQYKKGWGSRIKTFQLQKFISGVEVAIGAFFNGEQFVQPCCINFEHKKMFPGDIGPSTGEMGTSMFWQEGGKLFEETLGKMRERLAACGYVGYFDINCIANNRAIYPLEVTPRFGYPTINIQMDGVLSPWGEFLEALARRQPYSLRTRKGFQVGVVVAVPPFPFDDPSAFRKYSEDAVVIFKKPMTEGIHPCDIKLVEGDWRLTGSSGYALVATGTGMTMDDARKEAVGRARNLLIPNMFYRADVGERWNADGDRLRSWGYL